VLLKLRISLPIYATKIETLINFCRLLTPIPHFAKDCGVYTTPTHGNTTNRGFSTHPGGVT